MENVGADGVRVALPPEIGGETVAAILLGGRRYPVSLAWEAGGRAGLAFTNQASEHDEDLNMLSEVLGRLPD